MATKKLRGVDMFCGSGGFTSGLLRACDRLNVKCDVTAINHWDTAIETHSRNHPEVRHLCSYIEEVNPRRLFKRRGIDFLLAGPSCTHHSNAAGGIPLNDQLRASAWHVVEWAEALQPKTIIVENVREFLNWGPLTAAGRPHKRLKGQTFKGWLFALESMGYKIEHRLLTAADYGSATSRQRLFVVARRGNAPIPWPVQTHDRDGAGGLPRWRAAREIIDWSLPSQSIFNRKRPLKESTLLRIAAGLKKFCNINLDPFLVVLRGKRANTCQSLDNPLPTLTAGGEHMGLCQPFIVPQFGESTPRAIDRPLGTITTTSRGIGLCQPFIMPLNHGRNDTRTYSIEEAMRTITTVDAWSLIQPFLVRYNGGCDAEDLSNPLGTITTRDRYGLCVPGLGGLDIFFRMLQPKELARATGFAEDYYFAGSREDIVKQIGNAVTVEQAESITYSQLAA